MWMRCLGVTVLIAGLVASPALGQATMEWPVGFDMPYPLDSGLQDNLTAKEAVVYSDTIVVEEAAWLRVHFGEVTLDRRSRVRVTSLFDGDTQELNAADMAEWSNSTAYFNGNALLIELIAGPKTIGNRFSVDHVSLEIDFNDPLGSCGICGSDDRVPSSEEWTGRLLPVGCTGSVYTTNSCIVSAGHCASQSSVIQFRVPASNSNCTLNHPPSTEQFPIVSRTFINGGVGNDWAVMTTGTNSIGQRAYERYGVLRRISQIVGRVGDPVTVWGYGVDSQCTRTQTQQTHSANITTVTSTYYNFNVDITGGNSGSALILNATNEIVGIVTHCTQGFCNNYATRSDLPGFVNGRNSLCPEQPQDVLPDRFTIDFGSLVSGVLSDLFTSNDVRLVVAERPPFAATLPSIQVEVSGVSPYSSPSVLEFKFEASCTAVPANVTQVIEFYNYNTQSWGVRDSRTATSGDTEVIVRIDGTTGRFIEPGTGRMRARVQYFDPGSLLNPGWTGRIDRSIWTVTP